VVFGIWREREREHPRRCSLTGFLAWTLSDSRLRNISHFLSYQAVIFLARRRIRRYANDRCEVFFCSRLFVCVFVSGNFVFVG
jgi:hypothetical protein